MTVTGPAFVNAGTPEEVTVNWNNLTLGTIYLGGISHINITPDGPVSLTVISIETNNGNTECPDLTAADAP